MLGQASIRVGSVYGAAARVLLELADTARGQTVEVRHQLAYDAFCAAECDNLTPGQQPRTVVLSTFRTRTEKDILDSVAVQLVKMVEEKLNYKRRRAS